MESVKKTTVEGTELVSTSLDSVRRSMMEGDGVLSGDGDERDGCNGSRDPWEVEGDRVRVIMIFFGNNGQHIYPLPVVDLCMLSRRR